MKRLSLLLALSVCPMLMAVSPEVEEIDKKTAEALRAADIAFPSGVEDLNKKYLESLRKVEAERQKAGDLKSLLLVRDDIKLFEEKLEIHNGASFPGLQFWREAYAQKYHQLRRENLERKLALLEAHRSSLDALRKQMTQKNLIEDAISADQALQDFAPKLAQAKEELKAWMAKTPAESVGLTAKAASTEPGTTPAPTADDPFPNGGTPKTDPTVPKPDPAAALPVPGKKNLPVGRVIAWGRPDFGQNDIPMSFRDAADVAAGWYHSVGLSPEGKVRTWGGRGYNGAENKIEPINAAILKVPDDLPPAVGVAAGASFSAARFADGTIRVWGVGEALNVPAEVTDVVDLQGGKDYLIALRADGRVFVWGAEVKKYKLDVPENLGKVAKISAGAFHIVVLTTDDKVKAWGDNTFEQCKVAGDFHFAERNPKGGYTPEKTDTIVGIAAGSEASYALGKSGKIYGWGCKEFNQQQIPETNNFVHIDAGDRFCVGITKVGRVVVWGTKSYPLTPDGKAQDVVKVSALNDQILAVSADDNSGMPFIEKWRKWNPGK